jgi:hypothetical protein
MKNTRNIVLALSLLGSAAGVASAQTSISAGIQIGSSGRASVDLGFFYDNLASYGNWIERPSYGWVWTPSQVSSSWRPYQDGHWVWTDQGWTWISEEPYGWATYHYGRWYEDPEIGWSWVPGDEWAPAWVDWQAGEDYVGWAPLPPSYDINAGYRDGYDRGYGGGYNGGYNNGYGGGYSYDTGYRPSPESYIFVPERNFLSVSISAYIVPRQRVSSFFSRTRNYTNYRHDGGRIYNQGLPVDQIQRVVGRTVTRYQIADLGADGYRQRGGTRIEGNRVQIFRPQVQRSVRVDPPVSRPTARRAVVSAEQFRVNHPNRANRRQVQGQDQVQGQNDRQRTYGGQRQGGQVQPQVDRQRTPETGGLVQRDQYRRPTQVQPENDRQNDNPRDRNQTRDRTDRQRQDEYQPRDRQVQPQNDRQRAPQTDRQRQNDNQPRNRQVQPQNDRQRQPQTDRQNDRQYQRPPQAEPQRQVQPQEQPQVNRDGETRGRDKDKANQKDKAKQRDRRDRNQNQDDDEHRPPVR